MVPLAGSARSADFTIQKRYFHVRLRGSDAAFRAVVDNYWLDKHVGLLFEGYRRRLARAEVRSQPILNSWQALIDYLTIDMAHLTVERVRVLYLDTRNRLIVDHHVGDGSIDEAAIHPREVVRKALDVGATAMILVHNHPSGNPEPSRADIEITRRIAEAGRLLGIVVHDHVIDGREGHSSLKAKGLI